MEQQILWSRQDEIGLEYLTLREDTDGSHFESVVIGENEGEYFRLWYQIVASPQWQVQSCLVRLLTANPGRQLSLQRSEDGQWTAESDQPLASLEGCIDVDISITPATNTLPLRRLELVPGQSAELQVVYISVPDLTVRPFRQRYTCLEKSATSGIYRYESLESGFMRDLSVDQNGLVIEYPGIWQRSGRRVIS